jgi:hypothetical protein
MKNEPAVRAYGKYVSVEVPDKRSLFTVEETLALIASLAKAAGEADDEERRQGA